MSLSMSLLTAGTDNLRWQHAGAGRYYELRLLRNLFVEVELLRVLGGLHSRRIGQRVEPLPDESTGAIAIAKAMRRRQQRGYTPVSARSSQLLPNRTPVPPTTSLEQSGP